MIEPIRPGVTAARARVVLFDFDGTLSLIRAGWLEVMVPMMVEILAEIKTGESEDDLRTIIEEFIGRLTGTQTIYQMMELAGHVERRGARPLDPLAYKHMYLDRLWKKIEHRVEELRRGQVSPEKYLVPGSRALLEALKDRGLKMYLASGTDEPYMKEEARLLDVTRYFEGGVFGALDDYKSFSKAMLIERIIRENDLHGAEFIIFGDGYVEIENAKEVGGVAVGVATDEARREGVDEWKRARLIQAGADIIIPEFREQERLVSYLFGEND